MKIKELLSVNFSEEIKDVIDLQDTSESHIQEEIENYIVTQKIASNTSNFINLYKSHVRETGIWISGFYGSGKSYFGKMLGYLLENRIINGTPFRDRYIQRLDGLPNQSIFENEIRGLVSYTTKTIMFDIAKQATNTGFAWVLFENFLTSLNFLDDNYGYLEYDLSLSGIYDNFLSEFKRITGKNWLEARRSQHDRTSLMKKALTESMMSKEQLDELFQQLTQRRNDFDSQSLKEEISRYLDANPDTRLVFIIDEVSEAVDLKKIDLLELEAISESLSSLPYGLVWTIAIAQEKLDEVITKAQISRTHLNKVADRFRTKYHLSSEEVDTVIQKRLLIKESSADGKLAEFYADNSGQITETTNVSTHFPAKTETLEAFKTYYPFHKYQFILLQDFLFSVYQKSRTGGTERGMITATHEILKTIVNRPVFEFVSGENLVDGGKKTLEGELERKFVNAESVLENVKSAINGSKLLKIIYLLEESGKVNITPENITRLYLNDISKYYKTLELVRDALNILTEANLLIEKNGIYKVATDLEQGLVKKMREKTVEFHTKKRRFIEYLKSLSFINTLSSTSCDSIPYRYHIKSDQGEDILSAPSRHLQFQLAIHYNVEEAKSDNFIERMRSESHGKTNIATIIPQLDSFKEIDPLIDEIIRYQEIEQDYQHETDSEIRDVLKDFSANRESRLKTLAQLLEKSYLNGTLIYYFEEHRLNESDFSQTIKDIQTRIIKNTYTERLSDQLSDERTKSILKETNPSNLQYYFEGADFKFFDSDGNFIGENLKVVQKIVSQISTVFVDGAELERRFSEPPYGYSYGTLNVVLAVLFRVGRLAIKNNNVTYYNYREQEAQNTLLNSHTFKKASFKAISDVLSYQQKKELVDTLKELKAAKVLSREFQYNSPDIELVGIIAELANYYIQKMDGDRKLIQDFDRYFGDIDSYFKPLQAFKIKITDSNCKPKAEEFIANKTDIKNSVKHFENIIRFSENNLTRVREFTQTIESIIKELDKLGTKYSENPAYQYHEDYKKKLSDSVMDNFKSLEQINQKIKDEYHNLMKTAHQAMTANHQDLKDLITVIQAEAIKAGELLNRDLLKELESHSDYTEKHICLNFSIDRDVSCENCHFALNEIISANETIELRKKNIEQQKYNIQYPEKETAGRIPKKKSIKFERREYKVGQFRAWLKNTTDEIASLDEDDIVSIE